ncbi:phosphotransferase [Glaciecola sp. 1036]|uniref:phosphotransferase n=1 Tax=Alteromonadaceae TaxID=72275 RepID=UPI003D06FDA2
MSFNFDQWQKIQSIQSLWSGYGEIARYQSELNEQTIIVKEINLTQSEKHPRGWNTDISHQRKLSSYANEICFYREFAHLTNSLCKVPAYIHSQQSQERLFLIMQDLDALGFTKRHADGNLQKAKQGLTWLANFHATFMLMDAPQLWPIGTYWHLKTRPDEWQAMPIGELKDKAKDIDQMLNSARFQTLVHGDAKLANFCFHNNEDKIAAVDFQYVGKGTPVKDVAYFIGSCFFADHLDDYADELYEYYLEKLSEALSPRFSPSEIQAILEECQALYCYAWADFERFLQGWSPGHKKLSSYSAKLTFQALR